MSSVWTNLLLLHGHIHDPGLVRRLASTPSVQPPRRPGGKRQKHGLEPALSLYAAIRSMRAIFLVTRICKYLYNSRP